MGFGGPATAAMILCALAQAGAIALLCARELTAAGRGWPRHRTLLGGATLAYGGAAMAVALIVPGAALPPWLILAAVIALIISRLAPDLDGLGTLLVATQVQLVVTTLMWSVWYLLTVPVGPLTRVLLLSGVPMVGLKLRAGLVQVVITAETLCRTHWRRPRHSFPITPRDHNPMASVHVPVHAEPPEMVLATLDALAALDYPNLEVIVVDNNTEDEALWGPVQAHCRRLGDRFRFLHAVGVAGAKAGALNLALRETSPEAELVAVVDSDYQVAPDFLSRLVGHFDDPRMGFVQTPHDYRRWEHRGFLRMCYWEYRLFFHTAFPTLNERNAAYSVGTMCIFRRRALDEVGGWAEWCMTEDSEIALRLHARGYSSVYVPETFGRGLIPETFAGFKRQRYRWTAGPVQELKHHIRLLLPPPLGRPSALTLAQRFFHLNHGADQLSIGLTILFAPVAIVAAWSMMTHREVIPIPPALLVSMSAAVVTSMVVRWLLYRSVGGSLANNLGAQMAAAALRQTIMIASLTAMVRRRMPWRRTSKFETRPAGLRCLRSAWSELMVGVVVLLAGGWMIASSGGGLLLVMGASVMITGLARVAAPALAVLAEVEARTPHPSPEVSSIPARAYAQQLTEPR